MIPIINVPCECCGANILNMVVFEETIVGVKPRVMLSVHECPTCYEPYEPVIHTIVIPVKHQLIGGERG